MRVRPLSTVIDRFFFIRSNVFFLSSSKTSNANQDEITETTIKLECPDERKSSVAEDASSMLHAKFGFSYSMTQAGQQESSSSPEHNTAPATDRVPGKTLKVGIFVPIGYNKCNFFAVDRWTECGGFQVLGLES